MCAALRPLQACPLSGGKFRFPSRPSLASIRWLCRPGWACFFLFLPISVFSQPPLSEWRRNQLSLTWGWLLPLDSSTTAPPGSNRAGNSSCWCRSPTWLSKPDTGPYRGEFGFSVFVCLRCARKHILASAFRISFAEALFFVYSTAILRRPPPYFQVSERLEFLPAFA